MERNGPGAREPVSAAFVSRAAVSVAMLAGFYVLAAVCVLVVVLVSVYLAVPVGLGPAALVGGLGTAVALAVMMVRSLRVEPWSGGRRLRGSEAPRLWRLVEDVAARVGTRPPDELWLVAEANAGVMESTGRLGLSEGRRYLVLGVPLLQGLSLTQLRGVLAHEMGHYAGSHTKLLQISFRGHQAIALILGQLKRQRFNPAAWVLLAYAIPYELVQLAISRRQEFEADARAAEIVGGPVMMAALLEGDRVAAAWDYFLEHYVRPGLELGLAPTGVLAAFGRYLRLRPAGLEWTPRGRVPAVLSTHPPTPERIAALRSLPGRRNARGEESPDRLLPGFDRLARGLEEGLFKTGDRTRLSFEEYLKQCHARDGMDTARCCAAAAYRAIGEATGDAEPSMNSVLERVAAGRGVELRDRLIRAGFPDNGFTAMVLAANPNQPVPVPRWRKPPLVEFSGSDGLTVDTLAAALAATDAAAVAKARELLARAGIDPAESHMGTTDTTAVSAEPEPGPPRSAAAVDEQRVAADGDEPATGGSDDAQPATAGAETTGGLATVRLNRDPHDLLLTSEGLLFLPSTRSTRGGEARLWMLMDTVDLSELARRPGRRWLPYDRVASVRLWRRNPLHATIIAIDNRSWEVKRPWTAEELPGSSASLLSVLEVFAED